MFCFSLIRMQAALVSEKTKHYTLLLAFDFITHEIPYVLIERFVLGLSDKTYLVGWKGVWIHHTFSSSCADLGE